MIDCLILGDSIAVGVGQQRPDCQVEAQVGISSAAYLAIFNRNREADHVVISLGSNDRHVDIGALLELRSTIKARRVYWILPATANGRFAVNVVAGAYGDRVFGFEPGGDHVHPRDYRELAERLP